MDYNYFEDRNNRNCTDHCKKNDCRRNCKDVLEKYHELIKKSEELYEKANYVVQKEVAKEICDALKALTEAFKIAEKAYKLEMDAKDFLDKTDCDKSPKKCKKILCEADQGYENQTKALIKAGNLLKQALEEIEEYFKQRDCADDLYDDYVKCVHRKDQKVCKCR